MEQTEDPRSSSQPDDYFFSLIRDILSDWESARIIPTRAKLVEEIIRLTEISTEEANRAVELYDQRNFKPDSIYVAWLDDFKARHRAAGEPLEFDRLQSELVYETGVSAKKAELQVQEYSEKHGLHLKPTPRWFTWGSLGSIVAALLVWVIAIFSESQLITGCAILLGLVGAVGLVALIILIIIRGIRFRRSGRVSALRLALVSVLIALLALLGYLDRDGKVPVASGGIVLMASGMLLYHLILIRRTKVAWLPYSQNKIRIGDEIGPSIAALLTGFIALLAFSVFVSFGHGLNYMAMFVWTWLTSFPQSLRLDTKVDGFTPLMKAVEKGDAETVRKILRAGATPLILNPDRKTSIQMADERGLTEIAALLRQTVASQ